MFKPKEWNTCFRRLAKKRGLVYTTVKAQKAAAKILTKENNNIMELLKEGEWSLQEIFDKAACHLQTQKEKAIDERGECQYRVEKEGKILRCAVGCFISDSHYDPQMEGRRLAGILINHPDCFGKGIGSALSLEVLVLLTRLQIIHDNYEVDQWNERLEQLAEGLGLWFSSSDGSGSGT